MSINKINYATEWVIGITIIAVVIVLALNFGRTKLSRELAIYRRDEGAHCDLQTKIWESENRGREDMIQTFRQCTSLFVQKEDETAYHFLGRIPVEVSGACIVYRKSPQGGPLTIIGHDNVFIGGTVDGSLPSEVPFKFSEIRP